MQGIHLKSKLGPEFIEKVRTELHKRYGEEPQGQTLVELSEIIELCPAGVQKFFHRTWQIDQAFRICELFDINIRDLYDE